MSRVPRPRRRLTAPRAACHATGITSRVSLTFRGPCPRGVAGRPRTREAIVNMDMTEDEQAALAALLTAARAIYDCGERFHLWLASNF